MSATRDRDLYAVEQLPVFQNRMFPTAQAARDCPRGDLVLARSLDTGLVHNRAFRPELMVYASDHQNEQGHSSAFQAHLARVARVARVARIVERHFAGLSLIEVGSGKGLFLEQLSALGFDVTGLDPTCEGSNPRVIKDYFTPATGLQAGGIALRHVLEHVQDPLTFVRGLRDANGGGGRIYIEVPCLDWIARHLAGTGLQVLSPAQGLARLELGDDLYVMNRNCLSEIRSLTGSQYNDRLVDHERL